MIGWIIAAGCLLLLLLLGLTRLRVTVSFAVPSAENALSVRMHIGFIRLTLLPKKQKQSKKQKKQPKVTEATSDGSQQMRSGSFSPTKIVGMLSAIRTDLTRLFGKLLRIMELQIARLHIRIGTGDAASTALAYGAVSQAVAYLSAWLDETFRVKHRQENEFLITANFLDNTSDAECKLHFSLRLWRIPSLGIKALLLLMKAKRAGSDTQKNETKSAK